ncbi:hypothetical protein FOL47_010138 [Perkinsus chesapeaki]|uniref:Uncharacterized protein n=1 Tax=Perkinsus chesapeaki TaxID=330153 RepID=A0A7J6MQ76_PERCH|nr:hypothetical protein FOL47_010138 [Perkinsus chesapeaki]
MGFGDRLKLLRKPKPATTIPATAAATNQVASSPPSNEGSRGAQTTPEASLNELKQKLQNLERTLSRPAQSSTAAEVGAAQQLLNECRNKSAILESQADVFADQEKFELVQGVFETSEQLERINKKFDTWYNAATRTAVAHSVAVERAPAGVPITASQPVGDDKALSAFSRQIAELRMMIWDDSKPVDQCDLAIAEAKSCSEALAGRMDVWLNKNESERINKLMKCNDDLGDVEEEWKVLRLQRTSTATNQAGSEERSDDGNEQRREEEEALRAQKEEEDRLEKAKVEEEAERNRKEEAEQKEKEEAERKEKEEAERKEKEEADRRAAAEASVLAAQERAAAEEAERKKEEAEREAAKQAAQAAQKQAEEKEARRKKKEAERKEKEEADRQREEEERRAKEVELARKEAEEAKEAAAAQQRAAEEAKRAEAAQARVEAATARTRGMENGSKGQDLAAGGMAVGSIVGAYRRPNSARTDEERKEIEARNNRILWQMREDAAKKAYRRRKEAAEVEDSRQMQKAVQFDKDHRGKAYERSCLRLWSMYVRASQHARRRLYEAASDEEMAAAVDYATSIKLDKPSDIQLIRSCHRKLEESDRQAVLRSELKAAMTARDLDALEEVLPALPRDGVDSSAYRILAEERLRDAVNRNAKPAELEKLIAEGEQNGAATVYVTPAKALLDLWGARRMSDLMASASYCSKLGMKSLPAEPVHRLSDALLASRAFRKWKACVYSAEESETRARYFFELWKRRLSLRNEVAEMAADDAVSSVELERVVGECKRMGIDGVDDVAISKAMERKEMLERIYASGNVDEMVEAAEACRDAGIPLEDNFRAREAIGDALGASLIPGALNVTELERLIDVAKYAGVPTTYSEIVVQSRKWDVVVRDFREGKDRQHLARIMDTWHQYARYAARLEGIEGDIRSSYELGLLNEAFGVWADWANKQKDMKYRTAKVMAHCDDLRIRRAWRGWKEYSVEYREIERKADEMAKRSNGEICKEVLAAWKRRAERVHEVVDALNGASTEESLTAVLSECCYDEDLSRRAGSDTLRRAKERLARIRLNDAIRKSTSTPSELRDLWRDAGRPDDEESAVGMRAWKKSLKRRTFGCWFEEAQERGAITRRVQRCLGDSDDVGLFHLRATLDLAKDRDIKENDVIIEAERSLAKTDLSMELSRSIPSSTTLRALVRSPWLDLGDPAVEGLVDRANTIRASAVANSVAEREARELLSIWKDFTKERDGLRRRLMKSQDVDELSDLVRTLSQPGNRNGDLLQSTGAKERLMKLEWIKQENDARRNKFQRFEKKWDSEGEKWSLNSVNTPPPSTPSTLNAWPEENRMGLYFKTSMPTITATYPSTPEKNSKGTPCTMTPFSVASLKHMNDDRR